MLMPVEKIENSSNNLIFSEAAASLIFAGLKLATTKLVELDPVACSPGDTLMAECGKNNTFPVVVIDVADLELKDLSLPRLSLGSFISYQEAMDKLGSFFSTQVNMGTLVRHYVFIPKKRFDLLSTKTQKLLIKNSIEDLIRIQQLKHIFYPTMAYWLATKLNYSVNEWVSFLNLFLLIEEIDSYELESNPQLKEILDDNESDLYQQLIIGLSK